MAWFCEHAFTKGGSYPMGWAQWLSLTSLTAGLNPLKSQSLQKSQNPSREKTWCERSPLTPSHRSPYDATRRLDEG